jgi:outer membrane lipoprotein-sorting protein
MQMTKLYLRRISIFWFLFALFLSQNALARKKAAQTDAAPKNASSNATTQKDTTPKSAAASLESVLTSMDKAAENFKATEADFVWDMFTKVVEQTDTDTGKIYFRRAKNEIQMLADVTGPKPENRKSVLYSDSKIQLYQPGKLDTVTIYDMSKKPEFESYLVLGFGGRGHDLSKSFDVTYLGSEKLNGVDTEKINLVPKSQQVRNTFDHIILWIDPSRGISVQQQFIAGNEDYRLAKYSNIRILQKISDNDFKLKTDGKTKFVTP